MLIDVMKCFDYLSFIFEVMHLEIRIWLLDIMNYMIKKI